MSDSPLRMGKAVSISHAGGSQEEAVGVIVKNTPKGIGLSFLDSPHPCHSIKMIQSGSSSGTQVRFVSGRGKSSKPLGLRIGVS